MPDMSVTHEQVASRYGEIARSGGTCCGGSASPDTLRHAEHIGYAAGDLADLPEGANLGLGCGNPTSLTMINEGDVVLDLGSGAGIDCFLAAPRVGHTGKVIGVDMTDDMLEKATAYAQEKGYVNVEFRKGRIEQLPVDDASVDLVISNCVINLAPDKGPVFDEIARVLKPGGRAAISDIVLFDELPESVVGDVEAYIGCIAGAERAGDYLHRAMRAGLDVDRAARKTYDVVEVLRCSPEASKLIEKLPADFDAARAVASLDLVLVKPDPRKQAQSRSLSVASSGSCC